ncbi:sigma-70 family RNA polymerase sigma factor [Streptomyces sp. NPDC002187]|uniref:sigma-70 family RNA polymerase sigma factor n=1 Tax=Streptomyces sp. NPDC002187 TaxID=3364637 RepID=UPI003695CC43
MGSEADGYEAFFQGQYPRVVAMLIAFHKFAPHIAEDATAEAMTRLLPRWDKVEAPLAWVRTVAIRQAVHLAMGQQDGLPDRELADAKAAEDLAAVELALMAGSAVQALPPRQQEVMTLALVDMTPAEIAEVLGCTAEQARGNLAHARRSLRNAIRTEEEE